MNFFEPKKISMWSKKNSLSGWPVTSTNQSSSLVKYSPFHGTCEASWFSRSIEFWAYADALRKPRRPKTDFEIKKSRMPGELGCNSPKSYVQSHTSKLFSIFWIGRNRKIVIFWLFSKLYSFGCFQKNHVFGPKVLPTTKMR